jgi:hypothetical protein
MNIKWKRGDYIKFYASTKIRVGGKDNTVIEEGDEFDYDGSILKYAGAEIASPQLRGAILSDWASLKEDEIVKPGPFRPSRNVAASKSVNTDLSRVQRVGSKMVDPGEYDEETVLKVGDRGMDSDGHIAQRKHITKENNRSSTAGRRVPMMEVTQSDFDNQGGVQVAMVNTPAKIKADVLDPQNAGMARQIETRVLGNPKKLVNKVSLDGTTTVEGVTIRTNLSSKMDRSNIQSEEVSSSGKTIGHVRHSDTGFTGSKGDLEVRDTSGSYGKIAKRADVSKQQKSIKSSKSKPVEEILPLRIRTARRIDPDFPAEWDFTGKLAERLDRVRKYGPTREFLEALYAAEGDQMRKVLTSEYPDVLG